MAIKNENKDIFIDIKSAAHKSLDHLGMENSNSEETTPKCRVGGTGHEGTKQPEFKSYKILIGWLCTLQPWWNLILHRQHTTQACVSGDTKAHWSWSKNVLKVFE